MEKIEEDNELKFSECWKDFFEMLGFCDLYMLDGEEQNIEERGREQELQGDRRDIEGVEMEEDGGLEGNVI